MINYSYQIERNEGNEIVVYEPKLIPKELPSLVYIEGPNSLGKSTLLNILALGFNGINRKDINKSLIDKMSSLIDDSYQEICFEVSIDDDENKLVISKEKSSKQIIVYKLINNKRKYISPEQLEEKYNLIYDIPDNPIERLNQLTTAIKGNQSYLSNRIAEFRVFVQTELNQAKNSRDPDQIIKMDDEIVKSNEKYENEIRQLEDKKVYLDILEKYTYVKCYRRYISHVNKLQKNIDKQDIELKSAKKRITGSYNKKTDIVGRYVDELIDNYNKLSPMLQSIIHDKRDILELWKGLDFNDILKNKFISMSMKRLGTKIETLLVDNKKMIRNKEKIEQTEIWNKIINLLDTFKKKDIIIPGMEKNIKEFMEILKNENLKYENQLKNAKIIEFAIEKIREINKSLDILDTDILPNYSKENEKTVDWTISEKYMEQNLKKLNSEKDEMFNNMKTYEELCVKKGINLQNENEITAAFESINNVNDSNEVRIMSAEKMISKINSLKQLVEREENEVEKLKRFISMRKHDLEQMKKKEPHKYQRYIKELSNVINTCGDLVGRVGVTYDRYIDQIIRGEIDKNLEDSQRKKYYEEVSKYLGKKLVKCDILIKLIRLIVLI